ncbi:ABC transporter ATP-binding protein [Natrarchaeobius oligotrophus]|uniref:Molybdate/tungstate import ATP-binding protein WtpC n=1 Tax=Natrarchaeobius chitinivorans TaxID=1679083 RepID=A0A3N6MXM2_NATCH|nr:ABC transporter ATP-binding protein [Natrarchaeobius chitinivorans]RQG99766.1 ABC transporter ATP-binding protein [Natrarchaeobius chitinivorans]
MGNGRLLTTTAEAPTRDTASPTDDVVLELDGVVKRYGTEDVISGLSLSVRDGEILTLLGPSGCGKTTTLRLIAGLEQPDVGRIRLEDVPVADDDQFVPPEERGVGVVFQEFALFPHLTARENVAFGLSGWNDAERDARVQELLELVGLESHDDHYPEELSGGQQQRIALARSLAPEPEMLLLDEPFSSLDVDLRVEMREEVRRIIKEAGVTAISVTHDQEEALSISDRVAVMNDGDVEQVGTPERVFQDPKSRFVAGFLGHASFLSGAVRGDHVDTSLGRVLRDDVNGLAHEYDGSDIDLLVRPDDVTAYPADESEANGRVVYRRYLGPTVLYRVELDSGETIECMHNHSDRINLDERVAVRVTADHELAWFPANQRTAEPSTVDA